MEDVSCLMIHIPMKSRTIYQATGQYLLSILNDIHTELVFWFRICILNAIPYSVFVQETENNLTYWHAFHRKI